VLFSELGLHSDLERAVKTLGWNEPTPIQAKAIPVALRGGDILGCAQTGSGKTASFVLPILHHLLTKPGNGLRAFVIVPTRELAAQVEICFKDCGKFSPVRVASVIGGVGYDRQRKSMSGGASVIVATPGRLLDHLKNGRFKMDSVQYLVLDEADRMLDMGFLPDIRAIISRVPRDRQTMLFSATLVKKVDQIAAFALRNPERVEVSRPTETAEGISQVVYPITQAQKTDLLVALLKATEMRSVLVFTRTKNRADRLTQRLSAQGFSVGILHAGRTQGQRMGAMENFRSGRTQILVATDIAARGIDVREISHVINFDVPQNPEDYVHRVGRTGRAYGVGDAITFCDREEDPLISGIERFTGVVFPRAMLPTFPYAIKPNLEPTKAKTFSGIRFRRRPVARSRRALFRR
jgi:ATP-dependent RNA helicase RhlE